MKLTKMLLAVREALGFSPGALSLQLDKAAWTKLPAAVQGLYAEKDGAYHLDVEGVEDVSGLRTALDSERALRKTAEREFKAFRTKFEGIDADKVRDMLNKLGNDEEAALLRAGKVDEVVERRVQRAVEAAEKKVADANKKVEQYSAFVLDNQVRAACIAAGVHQNAVEDALLRARAVFKLDDEGNAVQLDKDGGPVYGKDGKTPFAPKDWIEGMKSSAPHWFPATNAGGGSNGAGGKIPAKSIKRADFDALSPDKRSATVKDGVTIVD